MFVKKKKAGLKKQRQAAQSSFREVQVKGGTWGKGENGAITILGAVLHVCNYQFLVMGCLPRA